MAAPFAPMRSLCLLVLSVALLSACDHASMKRGGVPSSARSDSAIYGVLLDSLRPGTHSVRIVRQYYDLSDSGAGGARVAQWNAAQPFHLDSALIISLATAHHAGSVSETIGDLVGVRWIDHDSVPAEGRLPRDGSRILLLSRIAYSGDSNRALVFAHMSCSRLCGNGSFYEFHRSAAHVWQLVGRVVRSIS
jgi:hypothetical protein